MQRTQSPLGCGEKAVENPTLMVGLAKLGFCPPTALMITGKERESRVFEDTE